MTTRYLKINIPEDIQAIKEDGILLVIRSILDTYKNNSNEYFTDDEINLINNS
ncbi:MAG TPA: hypothetical protein PLD63_05525 [Ignavibacteria bacterium]|nr:hypothetical protein [Ignavibacteria bacterium]HQY51812.1 hypothetical protein [Ignavibacteria bacterium]